MKRYRIGTFSKRSGVSPDTLRYYEKEQLLHPYHDAQNEYRLYSDENLIELMQMRLLRSIHLPIRNLQQPDGCLSLPGLQKTVCSQRVSIEREIAQLSKKLERLKTLERELEECRSALNSCKSVVYPPMYCCYFQADEPDKNTAQLIRTWSNQLPYVHLTFRITEDRLHLTDDLPMDAEIGIAILKQYADDMQIPHAEPAVSSKVGRGVRCLLRVRDPLHPIRSDFDPLIRYLDQTGQSAVGPWHYRLRFTEHLPDGSSYSYIAMRVYTE